MLTMSVVMSVIFTLISFQKSVIVKWTLESLRNGDGNKNGKKAKHNSARASRYFIHVSSLTARLQREIVLFHVLRRRWTLEGFLFCPELRLSPLKLNPRKIGIPFIVRGSPNECWLHTNDACVIKTWRLWSWAPLVARNKTPENFAKIWRIKWDEIVWRSEIQLTF